ncbi:MAG: sugar phosphate isomerase [Polyangiaceae bacterium UTPRO1]|nr:metabolite traffic protein EboE [Myxococcales bacterium]OQY68888.1 MAG: sugar phosphate isomerase [Polyangiaceae bacterium UTPRO1]
MKLAIPGAPHLTYCTNVHPGETWREVRENLARHVVAVKRAAAPAAPFGVGLRLSAAAADGLAAATEVDELRAWLAAEDMYVFTVNGFPYGAFHGVRVKEQVYEPDWRDPRRVAYTDRLATLLAAVLPAAGTGYGSISTVPGAFRPSLAGRSDREAVAAGLLRHVAHLAALEEATGRRVRLALEPEPWCLMETVEDAVDFFHAHLWTGAAAGRLAAATGRTMAASTELARRHLGLCVDACHLALEFAAPEAVLARLRAAEIDVVKVQVSAGMTATLGGGADAVTRAALAAFADDVYLHQVVERRGAARRRFLDLPEALADAAHGGGAREWRIHFHVPLFRAALGPLGTTQHWTAALLQLLAAEGYSGHLEVETYTWDLLPAAYRGEPLAATIARELRWTMDRLGA